MTLVLNEIHTLDGFRRTVMVAAADRRLTSAGKYYGTYRKLFPIPYHVGALSYFGLAVFKDGSGKLRNLSEWIPAFIRSHADSPDLRTFCRDLHAGLERFIPANVLGRSVSGFQICGYDKDLLPEYWFLTNIRAMDGAFPTEIKSTYKAPAPHFRKHDAKQRFGWDECTRSRAETESRRIDTASSGVTPSHQSP